jgi:hypothetical protein
MHTIKSDPASLQYVEGLVQSVSGNEVTLSLKLPEIQQTSDTPAGLISQQIIQKGLFIEGLLITMNGYSGELVKVTGNSATVLLNKPHSYSAGQNVRLEIPKKRIAIVDFTVIRGGVKEAGSILMEQLTTSLIESRHYIIVERSKLNTIMDEFKLIQSGLTEEIPKQLRPKLMFADLILTGTLAEIGDKYDINLRLLNVRSGHAIAAMNVSAPLFKPAELRDAGEWNEDFETITADGSWNIGPRWTKTAFVTFDQTTGAGGSRGSLKADFDFKGMRRLDCAYFKNSKKRDLSLYRGIEFYMKGTKPMTGFLDIDISDRDDPNKRDRWDARFEIETEWKMVRMPFHQLAVLPSKYLVGEGYKPGKQILDLRQVEAILVGTCNTLISKDTRGVLWIDKIRFYKQ